ncbi:MAG: electron transfer flavoprotein subunit beta/FixA family protein [Acidobacteria bacterium]|nr:electron transfer flavoprotein subunit beta/FixA family protein [Acidobacteriota bacterium]
MKILVAIKQVPEKDSRLVLDASRTGIVETDLAWETNESDRYALETGLRLKETLGAGECVACTIGPERARRSISSALAMGCDRGVHLFDPAFQGGDPLTIARTLTALVRREEPSLVLFGTRSDDAGYGETALLTAGLLGWPAVFLAIGVEVKDGELEVVRELEAARQEVSRVPLPAVLAIQSGIYPVRYTSLKGIMAAKKKPVDQPTPTELGLSAETIGRAGARVQTLELSPPVKKSQCEFLEGDAAAVAHQLVEKLRARGIM